MEPTLQVIGIKAIREQLNYYIDDGNIPEERHEKVAYLGCSRRYLADLVINGYLFLKANGLEGQYWNRRDGNAYRE